MGTVTQILLGALSGLIFVLVVRCVALRWELGIYAVALVSAALIYVGFAAVARATFGWMVLESGGLVLFSLAALLGMRGKVWALVLGWAMHPAWDVLIHGVSPVEFVPEWYPIVCAGFDLFLAGYIAIRLREWRPGSSRLTVG